VINHIAAKLPQTSRRLAMRSFADTRQQLNGLDFKPLYSLVTVAIVFLIAEASECFLNT
jgi:hypothetical protein